VAPGERTSRTNLEDGPTPGIPSRGFVEFASTIVDADVDAGWLDPLLDHPDLVAADVWTCPVREDGSQRLVTSGPRTDDDDAAFRAIAESMFASGTMDSIARAEPIGTRIGVRLDDTSLITALLRATPSFEPTEIAASISTHLRAPLLAAIRGHELRRLERDLAHHRELEHRIAERLSFIPDTKALGLAIEELAATIFEIEYAGIYFLDPTTRNLRLVGNKGLADWEIADAERTAWDRHPGRVIRTGEMVHVHDTHDDPDNRSSTSARRVDIRSRCYLPVKADGEIVGALGLASPRVGAFDQRHVDGLGFLGDLAGLTWLRLQEETRRRRRDRILVAAGDAADLLLESRDWRESISTVLELIESSFQGDVARFASYDGLRFGREEGRSPIPATFIDAVVDSTSGGIVGDGSSPVPGFESGPKTSHVAVPIVVRDSPRGILLVEDVNRIRVHDQSSIAALRNFAESIASTMAREELENELVHAQRMEAVGLLAGGIAHDFNNLLWPIMVHATTLADGETDERRTSMLDDIQLAARRGAELVDQILFLSRRRVITEQETLLCDLVREALNLLRPSTSDRIRIESRIEDETATVRGDRTAVTRVIQNLVSNARHAIGAEGGVIRVSLRPSNDHRDEVLLVVQDDGEGIPEAIRHNLFDPYFSTRQSGRGTGLGLTIVHRVVTELGGEIEVASEVGAGTTFTVRLPRRERLVSEAPRTAAETPVGTERILLVDDDPMVLQTSQAVVSSLGYETIVASGVEEALLAFDAQLAADRPIELVLTDLTMPERNGIDLMGDLRARGFEGPLVLITGFGDESAAAAIEAGADRILRKPISREDLGVCLRCLLDASD
jgi:signal transduction histidine kinase/ActR/RegA family two-component response regulator/putative methionine-R-sulfoxide reductase with GAF domain